MSDDVVAAYAPEVGRTREALRDSLVGALCQTLRKLGVDVTDQMRDDLYNALLGHSL